MHIAALHPIFKEFWLWSWTEATGVHEIWQQLDRDGRSTLRKTGRIPPRYQWVEDFILPKVIAAVPRKFQVAHEEMTRESLPTSVHGLLPDLFIAYQPGGVNELDDLQRKILNPNCC